MAMVNSLSIDPFGIRFYAHQRLRTILEASLDDVFDNGHGEQPYHEKWNQSIFDFQTA